jgi:hypothetical protein
LSQEFKEDFMIRFLMALSAAALLAACGGGEPAPATPIEPAPAALEPASAPEPAAPTPMPDTRIGAINVMCGQEQFRVAFLETHAAVISADGASSIELPLLAADTNSAPGVVTYTDGKMTFARSGGGDTASVIRFARGRMAFQACAIAQN